MVYTLDEIASRVTPVAEKYHLKAVYVFGSYARGEATEESDIDFLIDDTDADYSEPWAAGGIYVAFEKAVGKNIDLVETEVFNPNHRRASKGSHKRFVSNLRRDMVKVYERKG